MKPTLLAAVTAVAFVITARPRPAQRLPEGSNAPSTEVDGAARTPVRGRKRTEAADAAEVARWCEALARAVRGGDALLSALRVTPGPPGHEAAVDAMTREVARSGRLELDAVDATPDLALALAVVSAVLEHGGPAAEPLDRAAAVLRARAAEDDERRVQSAQARLSAQVMTALPLAMLALLLLGSSSVRSAVATPAGMAIVFVGGALNVAGWRWMRRIVLGAAR